MLNLINLVILPLIGALSILLTPHKFQTPKYLHLSSLIWTSATFALSVAFYINFDITNKSLQFTSILPYLHGLYNLGIDGLSLAFVMLTTAIFPLCLLSSGTSIKTKTKEFLSLFLLLEALCNGVFIANNAVLFYIFFEAVLIPMFFIIGIWGGKNKIYATYKLFLYTFAGSVFFLASIIYLITTFETSEITSLVAAGSVLPLNIQIIVWLGIFISLAVKVPMFPFHTWLPDAHVEAPTAGSVILAGILIKIGGYGMIRLLIPILPDASHYFSHFVIILSIIAVIYGSIIAIQQPDIKKMIAYSSIAHMGFVTAGIFSFSQDGTSGAIFQMISHGFISGALFLCIGTLYERTHTRLFADYGGLATKMPHLALVLAILTMGSVGLPITTGFIGEFMSILAIYKTSVIYAILLATGVIFGACYMLYMYRQVMFGELKNTKLNNISDLTISESISLYTFAALVLVFGIYAKPIFNLINAATYGIYA